jgi:hypothetical protein
LIFSRAAPKGIRRLPFAALHQDGSSLKKGGGAYWFSSSRYACEITDKFTTSGISSQEHLGILFEYLGENWDIYTKNRRSAMADLRDGVYFTLL